MDLVCPSCGLIQPHPVNIGPPAQALAGMGAAQLDIRSDPSIPWAGMYPCQGCRRRARIPDLYTKSGRFPVIRVHRGGYRFDEAPLRQALKLLRGGATLEEVDRKVPGWLRWLRGVASSKLPWLLTFVAGVGADNLKDVACDAVREQLMELTQAVLEFVQGIQKEPGNGSVELRLPEHLLAPREENEEDSED